MARTAIRGFGAFGNAVSLHDSRGGLVAHGERGAAFLINALSVSEVQGVVAAGDVLPPKSTNFFPKVIAGLTINPFGGSVRP